nr:hypothetical protein [uncultured Flavobacterium sp.]
MKKQLLLTVSFIFLLTACKKTDAVTSDESSVSTEATTSQEASETQTGTNTTNAIPRDCYLADLEGNKIEMEIQYNPEDITGTLTYAFVGKDLNTGTFKGKLENNVLIADYTFQSEGVTSTRQIAFKLIDDQFVEGYGDLIKNGTRFKDPSKLEFNSNMPLKKVACP